MCRALRRTSRLETAKPLSYMVGEQIMIRNLFQLLVTAAFISAAAIFTFAQEPTVSSTPPAPEAEEKIAVPALYTYKVAHNHLIGKSEGELRITETGLEYTGESAEEDRHSRVWRDEDIKRFEIKKDELSIIAYEAGRIPLIPRKTPKIREGKSVRFGSERKYKFRLLEGEITPDVVRMLLARFNRSVATSVVPNAEEESGKLLFEIPVFHRHTRGGESGVLRVYQDHVVFEAEVEGESRHWRYADIRDIGNLGRYKFELATYEGQFGAEGKSYIFDLKRPMTSAEYDQLWTIVYERDQSPRLRRPVKPKKG